MWRAFKTNWRVYLIEAWALGMFMLSACTFVILLEHPASAARQALPVAEVRRLLMGLAMGLTAVLLIYSPWGKRSGAHMNPAVTIAFWQMDRISTANALWYILFQFAGGTLAVCLFKWLLPIWISAPAVNYAVTVPGPTGTGVAFAAEMLLSFLLLLAVLWCSNSRFAAFTGWLAGAMLVGFIFWEAPYSGMSINPARTVASALPAQVWAAWWIYVSAPVGGMLLAAGVYRRLYRWRYGSCRNMKFHLSGQRHGCKTYEVLRWWGIGAAGSK